MKRRPISWGLWLVVTLAAIVWLAAGNLRTEFGPLVTGLVAASIGYGSGRLIALRRISREDPVEPRMIPLRISAVILGLITFGPVVAAAFGWIAILPAAGGFLVGMVFLPIAAALFSDGYQGLWLDSLVFHGNLVPPEEDWVNKKR